ncbi:phytanoyl-CoA dioxygenase family protein [Haliangium ochraceum]|uniref:Phytanoyl-CoA dioxygenase n=1 Tax=Haliangium ochraceum (strain DSM 14365 / JCM 11303 / SMP-2) TaxID=502025 RepID=D0LRK5_HALO1|nr:phytanoyl-CoA dioxygenase family protein [Haliangium ochraceum]ACY18997.1 Phytanoyl-CoA dioxygenase [Haliangium ochraceum DSM 14365]
MIAPGATDGAAADLPSFAPLSEEQQCSFRDDGMLILPRVLTPERVAELVATCDALMATDADPMRIDHGPWQALSHAVARHDRLLALLTETRVLSAVVQLLSPRIALQGSQVIYLRALAEEEARDWRPRWHRDLYGTSRDLGSANLALMAVKCFFWLTDLTQSDDGMTLFAPGTHEHRRGPLVPPGRMHPKGVVEPAVRAGDVLLFENRLAHTFGRNLSGRTRKSVMVHFGYRWLMPADYTPEQGRELHTRLSPLGRALMAAPRFPRPAVEPEQALLRWARGQR